MTGTITGFLVLGTFVIPGTYTPKEKAVSYGVAGDGVGAGLSDGEWVGSATVAGRVYGPDGEPLAGAEVSLAGSGFWPARSVRTGADGHFHWPGVPAGIYELRASHGRLASPPLEGLILDPGARRVFGLRLAEGWTLSGQVVDARTGRPIHGASVHVATGLLGVYSRELDSDVKGRFVLPGIVGDDQNIYVEAKGYVPSGPVAASPDEPDIDVRLEPGATIEGWVVDGRGRPIQGVVVRAYGGAEGGVAAPVGLDSLGVTAGSVPPISASSGTLQLAFAKQASTGVDGGFRLSGLRSGPYTAIATHEAYAPGESQEVHMRPGTTVSDVRIVMFRGAELRGRVLDARGKGLEGIPVELRLPSERLPRMTVTGDDGSFAFRGVRGEVTVTAIPYDLQPASQTVAIVDDRRVDVELVLSSTLLTLRGRVVDERGFGVEGALVTVTSSGSGASVRRNAKSETDGRFAVPALPEPPYDLQIEHPAYSAARLDEIEVTDDVRVVLAAGVTLQGRVLDEWSGDELPGVRVKLEGPIELSTKTAHDGWFVFRQTPVGIYDISFAHPDYESHYQRIEVARPLYVDRPQEFAVVRLLPGGTVEGEVLDAYGGPIPGAEVTWGDPPDWAQAVSTDSRGRFRLRGVTPGSVWITARHPDAGENESAGPVMVRPQEISPDAYVRLPGRLDLAE
ncbi:MAG: carboxypeptidase-like regulatory domain-containing protein [Deltaproteobacteria bacterium]|nr:carboxypeptidase-like regulatory domain-containing protein [Deltaproteobacteria bacterium]